MTSRIVSIFLKGYLHNRLNRDILTACIFASKFVTSWFLIGYLHNRGILTGCHLTSRFVTRFLIGYLHNRGISDWLLTQQRYFWLATYTTEVFWLAATWPAGLLLPNHRLAPLNIDLWIPFREVSCKRCINITMIFSFLCDKICWHIWTSCKSTSILYCK